jgi:hypothetical protein
VAKDVQSVIDRTVPPHGRIVTSDSPRRAGQLLRASWVVEVDMQWDGYADWVATQLREFRLASREIDALRFSRPLADDVYYVTLKLRPHEGALLVEASFEAHPF